MSHTGEREERVAGETRQITFTQEYAVDLPRTERNYAISASDWDRVKRLIGEIPPPKDWLEVGASLCAGMSVTAIFALVSLYSSQQVPFWALIVAWVAAICGFLLSIALFYLSSERKDITERSADSVVEEMKELERRYESLESEAVQRETLRHNRQLARRTQPDLNNATGGQS